MRAVHLPRDSRLALAAPLPDREAALALSLLAGVGPSTWRALMVAHDADAERAAVAWLHAPAASRSTGRGGRLAPNGAAAWDEAQASARALLAQADGTGVALTLPGDSDYPPSLLDLPDPPVTLWRAGAAEVLRRARRVAVVGTRANSSLGERATRRIVGALAELGVCVVSGLARGIDTVAHHAAIAAGLPTVAVLGTGVNVPYPVENTRLHALIADGAGAVVAEPAPGTPASRGAFPRRNRIVAALAELVVVVEAGHRSGALITAGLAADLGRTVAAVPGSFEAATAAGTNALLRDGAHVLAEPRDVLTLLGATAHSPALETGAPIGLTGDEQRVWHALATPVPDLDALGARAELTAAACAVALTGLELRGSVSVERSGEVRRC